MKKNKKIVIDYQLVVRFPSYIYYRALTQYKS